MPAVFLWTRILSGGVLVFSERIHNLVDCSCVPCHAIMLLYRIKYFYLWYDTLQPALHNILMETKDVWDSLGTTCACVAALGSHGIYRFPMCVHFSVLPYGRFMTRGRVSCLIFLSDVPGRIKFPVAPESAMDWLLQIFILDMLNRVSCFGDSMLSLEELSVSGSVWAIMSYLQLLWIIFISSSSSSSSYKVL